MSIVDSPLKAQVDYRVSENRAGALDLVEFLHALTRRWALIFLVSLLAGAAAYGLTLLMQDRYEAVVRLNLVIPDDPGGVSPDNRRAPEVLTLVEHGFIMSTTGDNHRSIMMAKLRSRKFTDRFIKKHDVARHIFSESWDAQTKKWKTSPPAGGHVYSAFHKNIRFVDHNPESDIISIRIRFHDPRLAASWANDYVKEFNLYMRESALAYTEKKQTYLRAQLQRTDIVELHKSIYRLIEAQTAIAMLASSKEEYVFEVLDPAYQPFDRFSPARKRITILTIVATMLLSIFFITARVLIKRIRATLTDYQNRLNS
jgi:hypothetical protein